MDTLRYFWSGSASLYNGSEGPLGTVGDTIYIGLRTVSGLSKPLYPAALSEGEEPICLVEDPGSIINQKCVIDVEQPQYTYGFAEITRGSVTVVSATSSPSGATVSAVPVPPGLALLATGAVGLAAMRRRKKAQS